MKITSLQRESVIVLTDLASGFISDAQQCIDNDDPSIARALTLRAITKLQQAEKKLLACYRRKKANK